MFITPRQTLEPALQPKRSRLGSTGAPAFRIPDRSILVRRVHLVDDHPLVVEWLTTLIDRRPIRRQSPSTAVLVFSMYEDGLYAERALRAGAFWCESVPHSRDPCCGRGRGLQVCPEANLEVGATGCRARYYSGLRRSLT